MSRQVARAVEEAWFAGTPLRITYRDSNGAKSERTIEIQTVLMERSQTVLVCKDRGKNEQRSFRLDRIEAAAPLAQS